MNHWMALHTKIKMASNEVNCLLAGKLDNRIIGVGGDTRCDIDTKLVIPILLKPAPEGVGEHQPMKQIKRRFVHIDGKDFGLDSITTMDNVRGTFLHLSGTCPKEAPVPISK